MKIKFKRENGCCPYFIYNNYKYFIQDYNVSEKRNIFVYNYSLKAEKIEEPKTIKFKDFNSAKRHVLEKLKNERYEVWNCSCQDEIGYNTGEFLYAIISNVLTIRRMPDMIADGFDNYIDCLKYSKKFLSEKIVNESNMQIKFEIS